jgi:trigger factor
LAAYDKTLTEVAKKVSIPGFRKGAKIPPAVIENAWSKQGGKRVLRTMTINSICESLIGTTLKDTYDLEPIGAPSLITPAEQLAEDFVPGQDLHVVVKCDVWPEIQWKNTNPSNGQYSSKPYMGLTGSYKRRPFNQVRFESALNDLAERYATLEPFMDTSRALQMGDACKVNMVGYMATPSGEKGEPLPNAASGDDVEVILGSGRYMAGLVEGLEGGKVGETKIIKVRFPDGLKNKDLAGKDAIFDVTILSANKRILPTINDEFANTVRPGLTAEALRNELIKAVDAQDAEQYMGARNAALGKALAETLDVDIPDTLITNSAREKYALMMTDMRDSGMDDDEIKKLISPENFLKYKEIERPDIVRDFKVSMAVDEIARLENIQVPAYQVEEQLQSLKDQATKEGTAASDMDDDQLRRKVESTLERRMVYDLLAEAANLEVEYINDDGGFDEALMERLAAESAERERKLAEAEEGKKIDDVVVAAEATTTTVKTTTIATPTIVDKTNEVVASSVVDTVASSKEEDIELTTQVILNYINSDSNDDGVVDDEDEDDEP